MRIIGVFSFLAAAVVGVQSEDPEGYIVNYASGKAYKLMYQAQSWGRANVECERQGAKLAVPKSEDEFLFIQKLVRGMFYPHVTGTSYKLLVWLGISNLEDFTVWKNIDDENINDTGFHKWASSGSGFSDSPDEPHCVGMDAANPGLREYWCHQRQPYVCQILSSISGAKRPTINNNDVDEAVEIIPPPKQYFMFKEPTNV